MNKSVNDSRPWLCLAQPSSNIGPVASVSSTGWSSSERSREDILGCEFQYYAPYDNIMQ